MAKVIWLEPAYADLAEIAEYIAYDNPQAASKVVARVLKHVNQLSRHPRSGTIVPEMPDSRYRQLIEPPYRIFYRIDGKTVFIVHIMRSERILRPSDLQEAE